MQAHKKGQKGRQSYRYSLYPKYRYILSFLPGLGSPAPVFCLILSYPPLKLDMHRAVHLARRRPASTFKHIRPENIRTGKTRQDGSGKNNTIQPQNKKGNEMSEVDRAECMKAGEIGLDGEAPLSLQSVVVRRCSTHKVTWMNSKPNWIIHLGP